MKYTLLIVLLATPHLLNAQSFTTAVLSDARFCYNLHIVADTAKGTCILRAITIISKSDFSRVQEIVMDTVSDESRNEIYCDTSRLNKDEDNDFIIEDLDFDGYNDFRFVITPRPAYNRNVSYCYWRYNPTLQLFEKDIALDTLHLRSPMFDKTGKQFTTIEDDMGGVDPDRSHSNTTYEYHHGRPTVVARESVVLSIDSKGKKYTTTTTKKVVNGKTITRKKVEMVQDDDAEMKH